MLKHIVGTITILALLAAASAPILAADEGDVIIGQQLVLRVRFPAGGLSVKERADAISDRIGRLLGSQPFDPEDVTVGVRNKETVVLLGDNVIITADRKTAEYNQATPRQLAEIWAANLRKAVINFKSEADERPNL